MKRMNIPRQNGAILVVSLLLLLVMTLLGLTAMQVTRMEERMAGNTRDLNLAFQGAEAALRDGERQIEDAVGRPDACDDGACGVWQPDMVPDTIVNDHPWWVANTGAGVREYDGINGAAVVAGLAETPLMVVEEAGFLADDLDPASTGRDFYRITAFSTGGTDTARAMLESIYTVRF
jgi:type IV pilus assembly protein PilX